MVAIPRNPTSRCPSTDTVGFTCHSPAVRATLHVLRSSKAPSVALYPVECTLLRGFDSFRAHHLTLLDSGAYQQISKLRRSVVFDTVPLASLYLCSSSTVRFGAGSKQISISHKPFGFTLRTEMTIVTDNTLPSAISKPNYGGHSPPRLPTGRDESFKVNGWTRQRVHLSRTPTRSVILVKPRHDETVIFHV